MIAQALKTVAIVGNPNSGKTTIFNLLTGGNQQVGNWPGVTVEKKEGPVRLEDGTITLVDLPGIYSVAASSEDERAARDYLLSGEADLVVDVVDASNLERNLYLTTQLIEMGVPVLVVLTMMDIAAENRISIDVDHLAGHLGLPVTAVDSTRAGADSTIRSAMAEALRDAGVSPFSVTYPNEIEEALAVLTPGIGGLAKDMNVTVRYAALKLLEGDPAFVLHAKSRGAVTGERLEALTGRIKGILKEEADVSIADARYGFIHGIVKDVVRKTGSRVSLTEKIDRIALHRVVGIPIFLFAMYLVFWSTMNVGGAFIDFFDILFGTIFVDGLSALLGAAGAPSWLVAAAAGGLGAGVQTVATFIPVIFTLFLALSILEDSGYMARAAFVMDRFLRFLGLPGKAFVPLIVGFGCTVPAILGTRTLENRRDRVMTIFMSPFMSCGARLPVYALFAAAFFPKSAGFAVFSLYLVGILFSILTGLLFRLTVFKGEPSHFIMELPPYHRPRLRHIMIHTWLRLKIFVLRASRVIIGMVLVLGLLNSMGIGRDGVSFGNENTGRSLLARIGKAITPVFGPLGVREENWPATVGIFTGLFAKEAVVGTLNSLYGQDAAVRESADGAEIKPGTKGFDLAGGIGDALATIPKNLSGLGAAFIDPLGFDVVSGDEGATAEKVSADVSVFRRLRDSFTPRGAYAYLLFILMYFPCVAAQGAAMREMGRSLGILLAAYLTVFAWVASVLFYQISEGGNAVWIAVSLAAAALMTLGFVRFARKLLSEREATSTVRA